MRLPVFLLVSALFSASLAGCNRPVGQAEPFPDGFSWGAGHGPGHEVSIGPEHVSALATVGLTDYRYPLSWGDMMPDGQTLDEAALERARSALQSLRDGGIEPLVVLHHGELPAPVLELGGWSAPETVQRFGSYAGLVFARLGDAAARWATLADPFGDRLRSHPLPAAPDTVSRDLSRAPPFVQARRAARDLNPEQSSYDLLRVRLEETARMVEAHAAAVRAFRESGQSGSIGVILRLSPVFGVNEADSAAARIEDAVRNRWVLEPVLLGTYPADVASALGLSPRDLEPPAIDFLGIDYFAPTRVEADSLSEHLGIRLFPNTDGDKSAFGEANAPAIRTLLTDLDRRYDLPPVWVTANGASYGFIDELNENGRIRDELRVRFLRRHLVQVQRAVADGVDVRGWFLWTGFDGASNAGMIRQDSAGVFVFKDSARYLRSIAAANAVSRMPF